MPNESGTEFRVVQGDITQSPCDSIMACLSDKPFSSLKAAICQAAGSEWEAEAIKKSKNYDAGDAWIMEAGLLPYDHLYVCKTPIWDGNIWNEERLLMRCYRNILRLINVQKIDSLALPLIGTDKHRFPDERAVRLAIQTVLEEAPNALKEVVFTAYTDDIFEIAQERLEKELNH